MDQKLKLSKHIFTKNVLLNKYFSMKKIQKDSNDSWHWKLILTPFNNQSVDGFTKVGPKFSFLGPSQLARLKVNIHYNMYYLHSYYPGRKLEHKKVGNMQVNARQILTNYEVSIYKKNYGKKTLWFYKIRWARNVPRSQSALLRVH